MNKPLKKLFFTGIILFVLLNVIAALHAYKFTHFSNRQSAKTKVKGLTFSDKVWLGLTGISNPKPKNKRLPGKPFDSITFESNGNKIECWLIKADSAKGTIILFHGYTGEKSGMLDKADVFLRLGYNTLLVDFAGSGASEGNRVTLGYYEAEDVKTCFDYLVKKGEQNICLFGTSMGAAAILKAIDKYEISPQGIIMECPFGTMQDAIDIRFKMVNVPAFPMAHLLMFWGSIENGFWAYNHNPKDYAQKVKCPSLLMYGERDDRVTRREIDEVYANLNVTKILKTYPRAGHENYLIKYKKEWTNDVGSFLKCLNNKKTAFSGGK